MLTLRVEHGTQTVINETVINETVISEKQHSRLSPHRDGTQEHRLEGLHRVQDNRLFCRYCPGVIPVTFLNSDDMYSV